MSEEDNLTYLPLKVTHVGDNGKRTFDAEGKRRLIEACRQPGVSISGMALKAGINANQLHKWIRGRGCGSKRGDEVAAIDNDELAPSAFVPVVAVGDVVVPASFASESVPAVRRETERALPRAVASARLTAQLPNGVRVELECGGRDVELVKAMIEALGAR
jgi:transposase